MKVSMVHFLAQALVEAGLKERQKPGGVRSRDKSIKETCYERRDQFGGIRVFLS
jgi:hypothetical protein